MKNNSLGNSYRCRDMGEAAALLVSGKRLVDIINSGERHCFFIFEDRIGSEKIAGAFWSDTLQLPAREYHSSLKLLKSRLYAQWGKEK